MQPANQVSTIVLGKLNVRCSLLGFYETVDNNKINHVELRAVSKLMFHFSWFTQPHVKLKASNELYKQEEGKREVKKPSGHFRLGRVCTRSLMI